MRLEQMLGQKVGMYMGGTAAFFPYAPSPIPIERVLNKQQSASPARWPLAGPAAQAALAVAMPLPVPPAAPC